MSLDEDTVRRLSFIRYLYNLAAEQARQPEPFSAASVLTFHDAVELFLQLALEHRNVQLKPQGFMDYWDKLQPTLESDASSHKAAMRRLNQARVGLKHYGNRPSKDDIEGFRATVKDFFTESTPAVFGTSFAEATMVEFVAPESAKTRLKRAQSLKDEGHFTNAFTELAVAFYEVVYQPLQQMGMEPMGRYPSSRLSMFSMRSAQARGADRTLEYMARTIEELTEQVSSLSSTVAVLGLGIEPSRFTQFKRLTPAVLQTAGGPFTTVASSRDHVQHSEGDFEFCRDFVIESAVRAAEFQV